MAPPPEPIVCTLTTTDAADQALEWSELRDHAILVEAIAGGARLRFAIALEPRVADLVRREAACCAFLNIATASSRDELVVEVTSANPDAMPVISLLAGLPAT